MFIHSINKSILFACCGTDPVPGGFIFPGIHIRPGGTQQTDIGVFLMYSLLKQLISVEIIHILRFPLFIPDSHHGKAERLRMAHGGTKGTPLCCGIPVGKGNQIQGILDKFPELPAV